MATDDTRDTNKMLADLERLRTTITITRHEDVGIDKSVARLHELDLAIVNLIDLLQEVALTPTHAYAYTPINCRN